MANSINNLKFEVKSTNAATSIMNSGYIPDGPAIKNGWEEVKQITDNIKVAIAGMYQSVMELARDIRQLGGGDNLIVINTYKTVPEDLDITVRSLGEIDKTFEGKTGFFRNDDDALKAQQVILDYNSVFDKVRVLTSSALVELQDVLINMKNKLKEQEDLTNPLVVSDVEVKDV